jgi:hypothetical protein
MSDFAVLDRAALGTEGPSDGTREARGSLALKGLAILNVGGVILALFQGTTPVATLLVALFNLGAALLVAVYVVEAFALDRNRPWAIAALRPLLVLIAITGTYTFVTGVAAGRNRIPFDVVLAVWALFGPSDARWAPRATSRTIGLIVGAVPMLALMAFAAPLGAWGGALDVHEENLVGAVAADCPVAGAGPPDVITVHFDWSWRSSVLLPSGNDVVVIVWTGVDSDGHPLYTIEDIPSAAAGINAGFAGYPSTEMADAIAHETAASFRWQVQLDRQQLMPSRVELVLRRVRQSPPGPNPLVITATYVHAGLWRHDAPKVTCSW